DRSTASRASAFGCDDAGCDGALSCEGRPGQAADRSRHLLWKTGQDGPAGSRPGRNETRTLLEGAIAANRNPNASRDAGWRQRYYRDRNGKRRSCERPKSSKAEANLSGASQILAKAVKAGA